MPDAEFPAPLANATLDDPPRYELDVLVTVLIETTDEAAPAPEDNLLERLTLLLDEDATVPKVDVPKDEVVPQERLEVVDAVVCPTQITCPTIKSQSESKLGLNAYSSACEMPNCVQIA